MNAAGCYFTVKRPGQDGIEFFATPTSEGGYTARAVDYQMTVLAGTWIDVIDGAQAAVRCHFAGSPTFLEPSRRAS